MLTPRSLLPSPRRFPVLGRSSVGSFIKWRDLAARATVGAARMSCPGTPPENGSRRLADVAHYSRLSKLIIDVPPADHDRELAFWQAASGQPLAQFDRHPEYHGAALHGQDFWLLIQRLDGGQARIHLDIHTDDLAAEVNRLEGLGAERVQEVNSWWVLRDPAGLHFCVIPDAPGSLNDDNAHRWD